MGECRVRKMTPDEIEESERERKELREKYPWRYEKEKDPYANYVKKSMERNERRSRKK